MAVKDRHMLKRDGKFALHTGQIDQFVTELHAKKGHMTPNAFKLLFQHSFTAEKFGNQILQRFKEIDCEICLQRRTFKFPKSVQQIITTLPWERVQVDTIDVAPKSLEEWRRKGYRYLLTAVDCFSKFAWAMPMKKKNMETVVPLIKRLFLQEGPPDYLQSDNGTEFCNKLLNALKKDLDFQHIKSRPYKPWHQGVIERFNRTIQEKLSKEMADKEDKSTWYQFINKIITKYNKTWHSATGYEPYEIFKRPRRAVKSESLNVIMSNLDICELWLDKSSKHAITHYKLSESSKQFMQNQLKHNIEMYLKQRHIKYAHAFNTTTKRATRNHFLKNLGQRTNQIFKVGDKVAVKNPFVSLNKIQSKKSNKESQKILFGVIKELGHYNSQFKVELTNPSSGVAELRWLTEIAAIPKTNTELEFTKNVSKQEAVTDLDVPNFRVYVKQFEMSQRETYKDERAQIRAIKQNKFSNTEYSSTLSKLNLPLNHLTKQMQCQELMYQFWSSKFTHYYSSLKSRPIPSSMKNSTLTATEQQILLSYVIGQDFKTLNQSLINWKTKAVTQGSAIFAACVSIEEGKEHNCVRAISDSKVLQNYWCCQLVMSKIFIQNKWSILQGSTQNPFANALVHSKTKMPNESSEKEESDSDVPMEISYNTGFWQSQMAVMAPTVPGNPRNEYLPPDVKVWTSQISPVLTELETAFNTTEV